MTSNNPFIDGMKEMTNKTLTENMAVTNISTFNPVLDFFGLGGALRQRTEHDVINLFMKAFAADRLLALKTLFYLRDIRGGQGERKTFRIILKHLAKNYPDVIEKNLANIPEMGRWDDLLEFLNTPIWIKVAGFMKEQLKKDCNTDHPSLLAKWLPSENTSSPTTRNQARALIKAFNYSAKTYRKTLSQLRAQIKIVEREMCKNQWQEIDYEKVPSKAGLRYRKAFKKHDENRYVAFIDGVEKGEKKIHTETLYPYDLCVKARKAYDKTVEVMWQNLPNYVKEGENALVIADTSGSMGSFDNKYGSDDVQPIDVALSIALYFAERNVGPFHNVFITFSVRPMLQLIRGKTLPEKFASMNSAHWDGNTNLIAAFQLILDTAIQYKLTQDQLPKKLYIVSDMEFDEATNPRQTNFQNITQMFQQHGYELPLIVFWNVNSHQDQVPITIKDSNVWLVSGNSARTFEHLMASKVVTPVDLMLEILNKPRYATIVV